VEVIWLLHGTLQLSYTAGGSVLMSVLVIAGCIESVSDGFVWGLSLAIECGCSSCTTFFSVFCSRRWPSSSCDWSCSGLHTCVFCHLSLHQDRCVAILHHTITFACAVMIYNAGRAGPGAVMSCDSYVDFGTV